MKYKIGDRVYYRQTKVRIVFISRMGEIMVSLHGYNNWVFNSEIKPIVRCNNEIQFR
ncbi:hypothetical protein C7457_1678 [Thermovibrio guaymasensis]|uniref:Uncharacterized protein n=1 Tax=Thermovibrio guaymasensis TaxID=240167 RepID=A0A420W5D8_9BACT|nr:hypothetical protein C7457_1678 [Thermovibrio guaymasensis]